MDLVYLKAKSMHQLGVCVCGRDCGKEFVGGGAGAWVWEGFAGMRF